jgi:hypothetical protein
MFQVPVRDEESPPVRPGPSAWRTLSLGLLLLATAAGGKEKPWAELQPAPKDMPAARPRSAQPHPCQPENFIPGETPSKRVDTEGTPARLHELPTGEMMNINGWAKENERVLKLPAPFSLTYYAFGCAGEISYVLDISRGGKRHALYQHVLAFEVHPTKPVLLLVQNERKGGRYQRFIGLVDLESKRKTPLPALACVSDAGARFARFSGDAVITPGEARAAEGDRTSVCVWDLAGRLKARLLAELDWTAGAGDILLDRLGVLPHEHDTFYSLHHQRLSDPSHCELRLQSLSRADRFQRVDLGVVDSPQGCASKEAALSKWGLDGR